MHEGVEPLEHTYAFLRHIRFVSPPGEIDVEAASCVEAQSFVRETLSTIHLEESKEALQTELEENVTMAETARIKDCFYEVEPAKLIPPDQDADL